jgi:hypothetical protein
MSEQYLGDGLFVSFDGYALKLRAPRQDGDHVVFIEPAMFQELVRFADHVWKGRTWSQPLKEQAGADEPHRP